MITREGYSNPDSGDSDQTAIIMGTDEYRMYAWQILCIMEGFVSKEISL